MYERAKELAGVLYPQENNQFSDSHKNVIRRCLEGHDLSKLPSNPLFLLLKDGIILPEQV